MELDERIKAAERALENAEKAALSKRVMYIQEKKQLYKHMTGKASKDVIQLHEQIVEKASGKIAPADIYVLKCKSDLQLLNEQKQKLTNGA